MTTPPTKTTAPLGLATLLAIPLASLAISGACRHPNHASGPGDFTPAMNAYLQKRGDLCIARADWPVDVTPDDFAARSRDAVQMPVLETLKLVQSSLLPGGVIRYQLTALGKRHYIDRETRQPLSPDSRQHRTGDFCVARLSLHEIEHVELHPIPNGPSHAVVTYTYDVEAPAWTRDPAARRAFPAVDRVISGAKSATLQEELTMTAEGWVANELVPDAAGEAAVAVKTASARP